MYRSALPALGLLLVAACSTQYRGPASADTAAAPRRVPPNAAPRFVQEPLGACPSNAVRPLREAPLAGRHGDDSVWL